MAMNDTLQLAPVTAPLDVTTVAGLGADITGLRPTGALAVELSVVVPFYNPGPALRSTVEGLVRCLAAENIDFEVIAVSDGSTDGSEHTLAGIAGVRVIVSPANEGKGAALHRGFAVARGTWIGFIDADGDIDPRHMIEYLRIARAGGHAGVYADKRHTASTSGATGFRKLISICYSTLVTLMFLLGVRDTQTGCKVLRGDVLTGLLPMLRERRFAFDLEFFVAAKAAGVSDFHGAPVKLEVRQGGSTVTGRTIVRTVRDTFVIYGRKMRGQYRPAAATTTARAFAPAA
jgi:glycosyltransferase involved in cell wall biosynthesis